MPPRIPAPPPKGRPDLLDLLLPGLTAWIQTVPILGDLWEIITGKPDADQNDFGSFVRGIVDAVRGINPFSIFGNITSIFNFQSAVSNTATSASSQGQNIIDRLLSGYLGHPQSGASVVQLEPVGTDIQNRLTVLEGGAVTEFLLTSSTTIDVSAFKRLDIVLIGSSPGYGPQYTPQAASQPGGVDGGFLRTQIDVATLADPSAVKCLVGTSGQASYFAVDSLTAPTTWRFRTRPGIASASNGMSFDETKSGPGAGGNGGGGNGQAGFQGGSTPLATGGAGGPGVSGNTYGRPGSSGESASITDEARAGGAGGGGGGASGGGNVAYLGGNGGNAGYPGGGPGAPGASNPGAFNTMPSGNNYYGANANGVIVVRAS